MPEERQQCGQTRAVQKDREWFAEHQLPEPHFCEGDFTPASGARAAGELLQAYPELTALFCFNDQMAVGALHQAKLAGLPVPNTVSKSAIHLG